MLKLDRTGLSLRRYWQLELAEPIDLRNADAVTGLRHEPALEPVDILPTWLREDFVKKLNLPGRQASRGLDGDTSHPWHPLSVASFTSPVWQAFFDEHAYEESLAPGSDARAAAGRSAGPREDTPFLLSGGGDTARNRPARAFLTGSRQVLRRS